ncbi:MAG: hypothetical protein GWN99_01580 [Gemmatimonadetes bacterium]|uniref:Dipeptidylpeptidase IV N-terminal domain-containing protein n=1 Tax=Candidatus Kutchimonas denitrificans TaxID=3056748 RepID=A0AAE5CB06_9BACT|nr:hypothetical protein [Gemmatimonadota bacterium]NIR73953.1 hypothetical protein [Candidatus Kutchimonas denitrificans]NIR99759.1 hypothetical protein [Gemmatimonadota bacterium]NIT65344.1 hypothetical protein [Gemmatimonadota bacterium]NIW73793.1 hypothetical protein [Gemmatimonadota bacterium]
MKEFIREIHRRSLWQVLAIYVAAAVGVLEVAEVLIDRLSLPPWIFGFAIILLLVGLPIVLATAFVQEGVVPGRGEEEAPRTGAEEAVEAPPTAQKPRGLRRLLTWRNAIAGGVLAFALWGVVAAGWLLLVGPPPPRNVTAGVSVLTQVTFSAGVEEYPAFAPQGDRLAFSREVAGYKQIYVRSLATGQEIQYTDEPLDHIQPAWSADGRVLLYARAREGDPKLEPGDIYGRFTDSDVWRLDLASGGRRRLLEDAYHPAYSPDGARIAFAASWGDAHRIWVADSLGRNARQVTTDQSEAVSHIAPAWSPDGRKVAFQNVEKTKLDIRVVDLGTGEMSWLTDDLFEDVDPAWSPDGDEVFFSSKRGGGINLWRVAVDRNGRPASAPRQVTTGAGHDLNVAITPDGDRAAFAILSQNSDLWRLPVTPDSGLAAGPPEAVIATTREESRGAWSPDGRRIAFNSDRRGEMNLWLHSLDDGVTQQLTSGPGGDYQPRWSPDGRKLVFFSSRSGNIDIWTVDVETGQLQQLTENPALDVNPFYSPDGQMIAFQSDRGGRKEAWVMGADGSDPRQLTTDGAGDHYLLWTGDSRSILVGVPGANVRQYFLDGSPSRDLPWIQGGAHMSFGPDESWIMDVEGHHTLWVSPFDEGEPRRVFEFEDADVRIDYPMWSPDGRSVIFDRHKPTAGDIWILDLRAIAEVTT